MAAASSAAATAAAANPPTTLLTWGGGDTGLTSFDPFCLTVQAYLRFAYVDFAVDPCNNPRVSPTGELPVFCDGPEVISGAEAILIHLRKKGYNLDYELTPKQKADSRAFSVLVEEELHLALCVCAAVQLHCWWMESDNVSAVSRMYSRAMPFPWSWIGPYKLKEDAAARVGHLKRQGPTEYTHEAYMLANKIYGHLSTKLGKQPYFFGPNPTTLDAVVFGHLAVHYYVPLPTARLRALLASYPNLVEFLERVRSKYFKRWTPLVRRGLNPRPSLAHRAVRDDQPAAASGGSDAKKAAPAKDTTAAAAAAAAAAAPPSEEEMRLQRNRRSFALLTVAALALFSYQYQPWRAIVSRSR